MVLRKQRVPDLNFLVQIDFVLPSPCNTVAGPSGSPYEHKLLFDVPVVGPVSGKKLRWMFAYQRLGILWPDM